MGMFVYNITILSLSASLALVSSSPNLFVSKPIATKYVSKLKSSRAFEIPTKGTKKPEDENSNATKLLNGTSRSSF
jgi:hypothetical protein